MYPNYFGLKEPSFSIAPDPHYLFLSEQHREALAHLLFGAAESGGFVLLTGEVGTGKTTVCRAFLEQLPEGVEVALILNPAVTATELLLTICDELRIAVDRGESSVKTLVDRLNAYLLQAHSEGRRPLLIIDEAQNLRPRVLEQIRLLTNLETSKHKLLQIFLIGQPELRRMLERDALRQLNQRITARYHLRPLTLAETGEYIRHRIAVAGVERPLFSAGAIRRIYRSSGGVPRLVNILCDRALLGACVTRSPQVSEKIVKRAVLEVQGEDSETRAPSRARPAWVAASAFVLALLVGWLASPGMSTDAWQRLADRVPAGFVAGLEEIKTWMGLAVVSTRSEVPKVPDEESSRASVRSLLAPIDPDAAHRTVAMAQSAVTTRDDAGRAEGDIAEGETVDTARQPAMTGDGPEGGEGDGGGEAGDGDGGGEGVDGTQRSASETLAEQGSLEDPARASVNGADASPGPATRVPAQSDLASGESEPVQPPPGTAPDLGQVAPGRAAAPGPSATIEAARFAPERVAETLASLSTPQQGAFPLLLRRWGVPLEASSEEEACRRIPEYGLACTRGQGTPATLASLDRPALLKVDGGDVDARFLVLVGLDGALATIETASGSERIELGSLASIWGGEYVLVWQTPPTGVTILGPRQSGTAVKWLRGLLAEVPGLELKNLDSDYYDRDMTGVVRSFQSSLGLVDDGVAGPQTLIHLQNVIDLPGFPRLIRASDEPVSSFSDAPASASKEPTES